MKRLGVLLFLISKLCLGQEKPQVLKEQQVHVTESNVWWTAAVSDTMALCAINAHSIAVMNASFPMEKNVSRQISFKVKNKDGEGRTINSVVKGIADWNGEKCYIVELEIGVNFRTHEVYKKTECLLTELHDSAYKLYLGTNWLGEDLELQK